jgi:hypothetical protein
MEAVSGEGVRRLYRQVTPADFPPPKRAGGAIQSVFIFFRKGVSMKHVSKKICLWGVFSYPTRMTAGIAIDHAVCHGKPVIAGTRVLVSTVLGALAGGDSRQVVAED